MRTLSFQSIAKLCSELDFSESPITIDLDNVSFIEPFALVYLGLFMRHFNTKGIYFNLILPKKKTVRKYLSTQNFFEKFNFNSNTITHQKLVKDETSTSLNDIIDIVKSPDVAERISDNVKNLLINKQINVGIEDVCELVAEVVDNFALHSGQNTGAFMIQYYPKQKLLKVAIGDLGIGFRKSLCKRKKYSYLRYRPHYKAIAKAFEGLVSSIPGRGMGLYEVRDYVIKVGGYLYCSSYNGYIRIDGKGKMFAGKMAFALPGVKMEI